MLRAALAYAGRLGWPVFPVNGKLPVGFLVPHGVKDATTDAATIADWWTRCPRAGIAVATGKPMGFVVDVDPRNGGTETIADLERKFGPLPITPRAITGGGGVHYVFRHPGGKLRGKLGPGVDVKGAGGYIVAAPSVHPSGNRYAWAHDAHPLRCAVGEAPAWLLARLRIRALAFAAKPISVPTDVDIRAVEYLAKLDPAISGAGGHMATFRAALALVRGFALTPSRALQILACHYNPRCQPPWSEAELAHKVESAAGAHSTPNGYLLERGAA